MKELSFDQDPGAVVCPAFNGYTTEGCGHGHGHEGEEHDNYNEVE